MRLWWLPAYAPTLNLTERVGRSLKRPTRLPPRLGRSGRVPARRITAAHPDPGELPRWLIDQHFAWDKMYVNPPKGPD
jgi:hypothetical protein